METKKQDHDERILQLEETVFGLTEYLIHCTDTFPDHCGGPSCRAELGDRPCPFRQKGPIQAFRRWYKDDRQS